MMSHRVESHPLPDDEEKNIISQQQRPNVQTDNQVPLFEETGKCEAGKTIFLSTVDKETQNSLKGSKGKKRAASLLDTLISTSIVAPFTIGCWRGIWGCMDRYADLFPSWSCFTLGATLHAIYTIFKHQFHNGYMHKWATSSLGKRLLYRVLRVLYTYTFGVACIAHWRGGWIIIDNYLFMHTLWITTSFTCLLLACLAILRSVRNLIATPLIIQIDRPTFVFQFPTRYNVILLHLC
ncbi:PREDICTED: uncharacterized protein LOC105561941 isoform X2 [Vollenhovia emeryi]|uniref:uncharacterized protein LOC105561941 isoform X2 n=1 Tax=Vollenhovia emeryi TaxID=411798 RepID=UPI0005F47330|nr:PREDICTED: uncharacterized protein LOC105561941 isoform X2 [Vollenhovia emeryi]